jgi:hypothetical protein
MTKKCEHNWVYLEEEELSGTKYFYCSKCLFQAVVREIRGELSYEINECEEY